MKSLECVFILQLEGAILNVGGTPAWLLCDKCR